MRYDPDKHHRRSIRLKDYDYGLLGAYFLSICAQDRLCLFGDIVDDQMVLNDAGEMVETVFSDLSRRFLKIEIEAHVIMPNHCHGIIIVNENDCRGESCIRPGLGQQEGDHKDRPYVRRAWRAAPGTALDNRGAKASREVTWR